MWKEFGFSMSETSQLVLSADEWLKRSDWAAFKYDFTEAAVCAEKAFELYQRQGQVLQAAKAKLNWLWFHAKATPQEMGSQLHQKLDAIIREVKPHLTGNEVSLTLQANYLHYRGLLYEKQGLFGDAFRYLRDAHKLCPEATLEGAKLKDSMAIYYETVGHFYKAKQLFHQALAYKQTYGPRYEEAVTLHSLGLLNLKLEQLDEADKALTDAFQAYEALDEPTRAVKTLLQLLKTILLKKQWSRFEAEADNVAAYLDKHPMPVLKAELALLKASFYFEQGHINAADTLLKQDAFPILSQFKAKKGYGVALRLQAQVFFHQHQQEHALQSMQEAIALFHSNQAWDELAKSYYSLGMLHTMVNQQELSKQALLEALKIAEVNHLIFLVQPIEDALLQLDASTWQQLMERRVRHEPLFDSVETEPTSSSEFEGNSSGLALDKTSKGSLSALIKVGQAIAAERELDPLLNLIRFETEQALNAERCTVFLHDKDSNELWSRMASGLDSVEEIRFPAFMGLAGHVFKTGETLNIEDTYADSRFNKAIDKKTGYKTRNLLCLCIRNRRGEAIGVFQVLNKRHRPFNVHDEQLLQAIAASAGIAIENARLSEAQKELFNSFVVTLSSTIDARDPITAGHSERVADFAGLISTKMDLPADEKEILRYSSLLHDIGKIGIREDILIKDGRLTVEEYKHIQQHARYTYEILKNIQFDSHLSQVPIVAASHHEKMDGTGYYRGLKGEDIPFLSRILAVSDVFDAITSRRHYRNRMPFERVIQILKKDSGHFDPSIIASLFEVELVKIAEVLVKERLFKKVSSVAHYIQHLDRQVTLADYETIVQKETRTPGEQSLIDLFGAVYYVMPETKNDLL